MFNDIYILIPSRIGSTRLENKPLINIGGKTLIQRVLTNALEITKRAYVATDSELIKSNIINISSNVIMTSSDHISGTDRIYEAAKELNIDDDALILNLQGDEPFIPKKLIKKIIQDYFSNNCDVITVSTEINSMDELNNPNCVMVETDKNKFATKFIRTGSINNPRRHIGIYGYTAEFLRKFCNLSTSNLELTEGLEQLRALENNLKIKIFKYQGTHSVGVDTEEDLKKIKKILDPT